jgi:hypothetical protein
MLCATYRLAWLPREEGESSGVQGAASRSEQPSN